MLGSRRTISSAGMPTDVAVVQVLFPVIVIAQYAYTFAFNHLDTSLRHPWAGALALLHVLLALMALVNRPRAWNLLILAGGLLMSLCWVLSYGFNFQDPAAAARGASMELGLKAIGVYAMAIWILSYADLLPIRLLRGVVIVTIILGALIALTGPPATRTAGVEVWASITGRTFFPWTPGIHASAYFMLLNVFLLDQMRRYNLVPAAVAWPLFALGTVVALGYQSRTAWLMLALYAGYSVYHAARNIAAIRALFFAALGLTLVGFVAYLTHTNESLVSLGSGRIGNYIHRWEVLSSRDLAPLMFGTGIGSDWFVSPIWSWKFSNSHSDIIHTMIETGIVGLVALGLVLVGLYRSLPGPAKNFFYVLVISGLITNGLLMHVSTIPYFFLAAALPTAIAAGNAAFVRPDVRPDVRPGRSVDAE